MVKMSSSRSRNLVRLACKTTVDEGLTTLPSREDNDDVINSNNSSDVDDVQMNIAKEMMNFVDDDAVAGPSTCMNTNCNEIGSDYSDDDPTYVPDSYENSPNHTDEHHNNIYIPDSSEHTLTSKDSDNDSGELIIPESPSILLHNDQSPKELAGMILETIMEKVWKCVKPLKRRKRAEPSEWKKNISKARRVDGLTYVTRGVTRPAKVPKPIQCDKCFFKCTEKFNSEDREILCRNFYKMDFKAKKNFILSCIKVQPVKTRRLQKASNKKDRKYSKKCFFQKNNEKVQVCQKFFISTLCISVDVINDAIVKADSLGVFAVDDQRGKKEPPHKTKIENVNFVKQHIEAFPVMESHYCRKDTKKKYLAPDVKSINNMYRLYEEKCTENDKTPVSAFKYREIFNNEYNFSFFNPKKDLCGICTKYEKSESKEYLEDEYREHIKRKVMCQAAKDNDKVRANTEENFMSITMDLQAVLQVPSGGESILYYMRKLVLHNFTIYEARIPNNAYCLCWSEINGKKGSAEIGTCLLHYLSQEVPKTVSELSIFSDTCSGQNRNQHMSALLLWAVQKIDNLQIIEQKFLESGHSHMEVDSMHAAIENASKNMSINSISEWKNVFKSARRKRTKIVKTEEGTKKIEVNNYKVKELKYTDMLDLKKLSALVMKNKNKDNMRQTVNWLKIKKIRYVKGDHKIYFNYDLSDDFRHIDVLLANSSPKTRGKRSNPPSVEQQWPEELESLYSRQLPISIAKKNDLENMCKKHIIPEELHGWIRGMKTHDHYDRAECDEDN